MFLKIFVTSFFLSLSFLAVAEVLEVKDSLKQYQLKYSKSMVEFSARKVKLRLTSKPCNKAILEKFSSQIHVILAKTIKHESSSPGFLAVKINEKTYWVSPKTTSGKFFRLVPDEVKRLKIEESILCKS